MSVVDRLPELAQRLPEEIKKLEHESEVKTAARLQLWRDRAVNIEHVAHTLPITSILNKLAEEKLADLDAEFSHGIAGVPGDSPEPIYEWFLEWRQTPKKPATLGNLHSIIVVLNLDGSLSISGRRISVPTYKWERSVSSSIEELEQAIGFAYLEASNPLPPSPQIQ